MRAHADRYHNVFFAYRGLAVADVELSAGKQLEDNLTRALTVTLERASPDTTVAFLSEICSVEVSPTIAVGARLTMQALTSEGSEGVVVGISPQGDLSSRSFSESPAGSRPDLLIEISDGPFAIIESKAVGGTDGSQLWRHARAFGLAIPREAGGRVVPPDNWIQRSWSDVADWADGQPDQDPVAAFLLREFAEYLHLAGVTQRRAAPRARAAVEVETIDDSARALLEALAEAVDLDRVAAICMRLYGDPASPHYVHGDGETGSSSVVDDSAAVRRAYRERGATPPPRLSVDGGNVITARRALSIAYGPRQRFMQTIATAQTREAVGKLIGVGADRGVLLGLLAWAWPKSETRATRMQTIVAAAWGLAPARAWAADELNEELGPSVAAALRA